MGFGPAELRNYAFLNVLLDSFRKLAFDYCAKGDTPEARFERVKEIKKALSGDGPLPREITLTRAWRRVGEDPMPEGFTAVTDLYACPTGQHCEGGACVPNDVITGWPVEGDPPAWKEQS
jgi:hypothetical protein